MYLSKELKIKIPFNWKLLGEWDGKLQQSLEREGVAKEIKYVFLFYNFFVLSFCYNSDYFPKSSWDTK